MWRDLPCRPCELPPHTPLLDNSKGPRTGLLLELVRPRAAAHTLVSLQPPRLRLSWRAPDPALPPLSPAPVPQRHPMGRGGGRAEDQTVVLTHRATSAPGRGVRRGRLWDMCPSVAHSRGTGWALPFPARHPPAAATSSAGVRASSPWHASTLYEYRTRDGCRSELHPVGARPSAMTGRPERIILLAVADAGIDNKVSLQDCHCKATS